MTNSRDPSVHASSVRIGSCAVLIRGPSGAGKSRLAFDLILAGRTGQIPPTVLVGDDRIHLQASADRVLVRPAPELAGLIEIRGLGIRRCDFVEQAELGLVVDLSASDAERLPPPQALLACISGISIPRIPVAAGHAALPLVIAAVTTAEGSGYAQLSADCLKGNGNHISSTIATD